MTVSGSSTASSTFCMMRPPRAAKSCRTAGVRSLRRPHGFTLIELLVVLVVIGVVVASIQLNLFSDDARRLRNEGERLAGVERIQGLEGGLHAAAAAGETDASVMMGAT